MFSGSLRVWGFWLEVALKTLLGGRLRVRGFFSSAFGVSLMGLVLAVASEVVTMGVVGGFSETLKKAVQDVTGHVVVFGDNQQVLRDKVNKHVPQLVGSVAFLAAQGVVVHGGRAQGVVMQGVDSNTVDSVLRLKPRVKQGKWDLAKNQALLGKVLVQKLGLKVGQVFSVVIPVQRGGVQKDGGFVSRLQKFTLSGVLDLGRHDFNSRYMVLGLKELKGFLRTNNISGLRLRLKDDAQAKQVSDMLSNKLHLTAQHWFDQNRNLFQATQLEKFIIFLVLLVMVIAAAFNVSSALYVSVMQRFREISVLKAVGAKKFDVGAVFALQGLGVGFFGAVLGLVLGLVLCEVFMFVQGKVNLLPSEIYQLGHVSVYVSWADVGLIFGASFLVCGLAVLAPALRGARQSIVKGFLYE